MDEGEDEDKEMERYLVKGPKFGDMIACKIVSKIPLKSGGFKHHEIGWMIPSDNLARVDEVVDMQENSYVRNGRLLAGGYCTRLSDEEEGIIDEVDTDKAPI